MPIPQIQPFNDIALSLSGGGYRAAAFHLGTLSLLNEVGMLEKVQSLSTVSGGTILGAKYALELAIGGNYGTFEPQMCKFLRTVNVVTEAMSRLRTTANPNDERLMPSVIRAAANVYSGPDHVGEATFGKLTEMPSHLKEISFNATDFLTGTRFRFQHSSRNAVLSGSKISIPTIVSFQARIADIVAASSCFPGGFEPFYFPGEFVWKDPIEKIRGRLPDDYPENVPLMDGGVFDNQGLDVTALLLKRAGNATDLILISDTSKRANNIHPRKLKRRWRLLPLAVTLLAMIAIYVFSIVSVYQLADEYIELVKAGSPFARQSVTRTLFPLIVSTAVALVGTIVAALLIWFSPTIVTEAGIKGLLKAPLLGTMGMVELLVSRISSVLKMTTDVFMNRIRSLGYTGFFSQEKLQPKLVSNLIYDLDDESRWRNVVPADLHPVQRLRDLAIEAEKYPTTLNFTGKEDSMQKLIECGRATMCFNMIRHLNRFRAAQITVTGSPEYELYELLKQIWTKNINIK